MIKYIDGIYTVIDYGNGCVERFITTEAVEEVAEPTKEPTTIEILQDIKDTVDLMYLKSEGVL